MEEYSEPPEQSSMLSVKMDRENILTLLWPEWGSNPIPSDPQSASNRLRHRLGLMHVAVVLQVLQVDRTNHSEVALDFTLTQDGQRIPADSAFSTLTTLNKTAMSVIIKYPVS
jgi:hypothetical protein